MALSMIVNFTNPIVLAAGTICTWILVCVPFAFICRQINPGDRFADWEAYLIGQALGPVGLYLMKRELRGAEDRKAKIKLEQDGQRMRQRAEHHAPRVPEQELADLPGDALPGSIAFRQPPRVGLDRTPDKPRRKTEKMLTVDLPMRKK